MIAIFLVACSSGGGGFRPRDLAGAPDGGLAEDLGGGDPPDLAGQAQVPDLRMKIDLAVPEPSCNDNLKNGFETDVDCGGGDCAPCSDGRRCQFAEDCANVNCSNTLCCATNRGNCDGNAGNGCEITLLSDVSNCGGCGIVCGNGASCTNGACVLQAQCGNFQIDAGEEYDPAPGPFNSAKVDAQTCRFHFENIVQLYCNGTCSWAGAQGCDKSDADLFCKLKTGNKNSTATNFAMMAALAQPGFPCPDGAHGTSVGTLALRGVNQTVYFQDSSLNANHGGGTVVTNVVCTNP